MKLVSGNSNTQFAKDISKYLGVDLVKQQLKNSQTKKFLLKFTKM